MRVILLLVLMGVLLFACACASTGDAARSDGAISPYVGAWRLVSVRRNAPVAEGAETPMLTIAEDWRVSGNAGVNLYQGELDDEQLGAGAFYLGSVAQTKKMGPEPAMALERMFLALLRVPSEPSFDSGQLVLSQDGDEVLRFERVE